MLREYYIYTVILKYVLGKHNMSLLFCKHVVSVRCHCSTGFKTRHWPYFFPQIFFFFYGYWITDYSLPVTWCPLRGLFLQCLCCSYYYHYIKMIIVLLLLNYFCCCCCNIQGMTKVLTI